jgi:hypothetical protein
MVLLLAPIVTLLACSDFGLNEVQPTTAMPYDTATVFDNSAAGDTADTAGEADVENERPAEEPEDTAVSEPPEEADPAPPDDCTDTDDLVYVLSRDDAKLYTFSPTALSFSLVGTVDCGTSQAPGSMAVSRDGLAYLRYADNAVYELDLTTMRCSSTPYSDRSTGFDSFGMGYATDSADTWRDQLYVANARNLAVLNPNTGKLTTVGRMPSQSELTGNADGELWAILPLESPAELMQLDLTTGAELDSIAMKSFPNPGNIDTFAFATWDGNFYVFVREYGMGNSTDVYEVTRAGKMTKVLADVGFDVVGAGVSTCAPA